LSRMQERDGLRSRVGGRSRFVHPHSLDGAEWAPETPAFPADRCSAGSLFPEWLFPVGAT
jgi:hypothetical protein